MVGVLRIFVFFAFLAALGAQGVISTVAGGSPPVTPVPAVKASIGDPPRVAVDSAGNLYFGSLHSVFRVDTAGNLLRIAGNGRSGYSGDGGPALSAQLEFPDGIAVDGAGNVYVADRDAAVIRRIAPTGAISTVAGTGAAAYSGDNGLASAAQLNQPTGLAVDSAGNLYVADTANHRIRRIAANGVITTVAGTGNPGFTGDGGAATSAGLNGPEGVALDSAGNLYIADTFDDRVRQISPNGVISTIAGTGLSAVYGSTTDATGVSTTTGDNGPAASAAVVLPTDVATDRAGNLYIADYGNGRIRVVSKSVINTVAGSAGGIAPTDGQDAFSARLNGPTGVAADASGSVYFAESSVGTGSGLAAGDFKIWKVTAAGILVTAAGDGISSYSGDGGSAAYAQLNLPTGMAMDAAGNLYFADSLNHRIRRIRASGAIDTVAGSGSPGFSGDGSAAIAAQLYQPKAVAVDSAGNLLIADTGNNRIRMVSLNGVIATVAGNGNASFFGDGQPAVQASLHAPLGLALDRSGAIYVADTLNQRVRRITSDGIIHTVAGNGNPGSAADGAQASAAPLNLPSAVAIDAAGNLLIAEQGSGRLRSVSSSGIIVTLAAALASPQSVTIDNAGNIYIADTGHNSLLQLAPDGALTTVAGMSSAPGDCCYSGDGGPATGASLNAPWGVAVDASGNVYLADSANNAIRAVRPAQSTPMIGAIANGASNLAGAIAPGEVVVIYGAGLGPPQLVAAVATQSTQLAGVSVSFNGIAGQMLYAVSGQLSVIVPAGLTGANAQIVVQNRNLSATASVAVTAAAPALFTSDDSGAGEAYALNVDGSANGPARPAAAGSAVTLFATGTNGSAVTVTIGGLPAAVLSTNAASPGVLAITVEIPSGSGATAGSVVQNPVVVQSGGVSSPPGVTIAVAGN